MGRAGRRPSLIDGAGLISGVRGYFEMSGPFRTMYDLCKSCDIIVISGHGGAGDEAPQVCDGT